jgi:hypothetical protein
VWIADVPDIRVVDRADLRAAVLVVVADRHPCVLVGGAAWNFVMSCARLLATPETPTSMLIAGLKIEPPLGGRTGQRSTPMACRTAGSVRRPRSDRSATRHATSPCVDRIGRAATVYKSCTTMRDESRAAMHFLLYLARAIAKLRGTLTEVPWSPRI